MMIASLSVACSLLTPAAVMTGAAVNQAFTTARVFPVAHPTKPHRKGWRHVVRSGPGTRRRWPSLDATR